MMYNVNDVVSLKLSSGDEVIGRFQETTTGKIALKKPCTFMMGQQGIGLVPYAFSADEDATLEFGTDFIVVSFKTSKMIADQYIKQTTGLLL
jgi:hypothetical protein